MTPKCKQIREKALELSIEERSWLADELWESTLSDEQRAIQQEWIEVAERRLEELRSGAVKGIPAEEVMERLKAKLRAARRVSSRG